MPIELPPDLNPFRDLADDAPCWCLSGQPFVNCHKSRASHRRANPQEALNLLRRQFNKKIGCLHPDAPKDCAGKIIDSHTIQKSGPLKTIARNGEVYSMRGSGGRLVENNGRVLPQRKGISTVSTFPGFCAHHDNSFFAPIENGVFDINPSNCFLLHYRNVCGELHAKTSMPFGNAILDLMDGGRDEFGQLLAQQVAADMNFGASLAQTELEEYRDILSVYFKNQDYSSLYFYFIEFESQLPFVTSFVATPKFSFNGMNIQDWSEELLRNISFSSVNFDGRSGFVLSSTDRDLFLMLTSELEDRSVGTSSTLLRWVVANAENVAFEIEWWDHLSDRRRIHLLDLAMIGLPFGDDDELAVYRASVEVLPPTAVTRSFAF